jgi:hypothetical protein
MPTSPSDVPGARTSPRRRRQHCRRARSWVAVVVQAKLPHALPASCQLGWSSASPKASARAVEHWASAMAKVKVNCTTSRTRARTSPRRRRQHQFTGHDGGEAPRRHSSGGLRRLLTKGRDTGVQVVLQQAAHTTDRFWTAC